MKNKKCLLDKYVTNFITVDPGMNGHTGYAIWSTSLCPLITGIIRPTKKTKVLWEYSNYMVAKDLYNAVLASGIRVQQIYIEMPEYWSGSLTSRTATAKGDLFKLVFLVSSIWNEFTNKGCISNLIAPREWKGQLKKEMVDFRIKKILGVEYPEHISDAVGIGLFLKGEI